jgi:hypothetical protein
MQKWPLWLFPPMAIGLRFYIEDPVFSFLWFVILYFPMINWSTYWLFCLVRLGVNRLGGKEVWTSEQIRRAFVIYLYAPGSLAFSELIYQGYKYNVG